MRFLEFETRISKRNIYEEGGPLSKLSILAFYEEQIITFDAIELTMSAATETNRDQENGPSTVKAIQDAINTDDRIGSDQQPISTMKPRAREIIKIIGTRGDHRSRGTVDQESTGISAPELAEREEFGVGVDTLRNDLRTLVKCSYLNADESERPYRYTIADSWITPATTDAVTDGSSTSSQGSAIDERISTHETEYAEPSKPIKNYQRVSMLVSAAQANLTPIKHTVASIFGIGGCVVGLFGVLLWVSGLYLSPHLVAAGDSSIQAGLALLFGWFWIHFVGLVNAMSDDEEATLS
ncbi:DUF4386 domain-containing protein [Halobacterium sp. KA-4]|uniref:DUF4386 domain-containing protein n=1 Tax=Halobacterium sp. KA-4 TaxID=2896367 RepID=UPI001E57E29C|nr:DUF4386 domain-containing protein [Halobacterium sp. KA-4]MCD2201027.1 DUF4386 domain-containing protein [Halobacterium sp. KA-4]